MLRIPDQDWNNVKKAFSELSVPLTAHQGMMNIFQIVENQFKVNDEDKPDRPQTD